jgi:hypothetical protein
MADATKGRWRELCAQATVEQDPEKLRMLVDEFTRLLDVEEESSRKPELLYRERSV